MHFSGFSFPLSHPYWSSKWVYTNNTGYGSRLCSETRAYALLDRLFRYYEGISSQTVNWTSLVFMIVYIPLIFPGAWIMDKMVCLVSMTTTFRIFLDNTPLDGANNRTYLILGVTSDFADWSLRYGRGCMDQSIERCSQSVLRRPNRPDGSGYFASFHLERSA